MIIDKIENAEKYYSLHPRFEAAFNILKELTEKSADGKTVVDGENIFINLSTYRNKPVAECGFEVHEDYIDIQYSVCGKENIDICDGASLAPDSDRKAGDDCVFLKAPADYSTASLSDGIFTIIFPGEAHRPGVAPKDIPQNIKKAVAKIKFLK